MAATACIHHRLRREYRQYEHTAPVCVINGTQLSTLSLSEAKNRGYYEYSQYGGQNDGTILPPWTVVTESLGLDCIQAATHHCKRKHF